MKNEAQEKFKQETMALVDKIHPDLEKWRETSPQDQGFILAFVKDEEAVVLSYQASVGQMKKVVETLKERAVHEVLHHALGDILEALSKSK